MYLDRVTVDEGGVELLGGYHLLLEHLEVVLHQGGLVTLPRASVIVITLRGVLGQQGLESGEDMSALKLLDHR